VEPNSAFRRAWDVLESHAGIIWTARICAIIAGLMTAALLCVLALFIDLLISQGRIPAYAELGVPNRETFAAGLTE
jgi:hypothetical protein